MKPEDKQELVQLITNLAAIDPQSLVRRDDLGEALSFAAGLPHFERISQLYRQLAEVDLEIIPDQQASSLLGSAKAARQALELVGKFSASQDSPVQKRDQVLASVASAYHSCFQSVTPFVAYWRTTGDRLDRLHTEAAQATATVQSTVQEIEHIRDSMRQAAEVGGVTPHALHFQKQAREHLVAARWWLGVSGVFSLLTLTFAAVLFEQYFKPPQPHSPSSQQPNVAAVQPDDTPRAIQLTIGKLLLFSVLSALIYGSARIYRSHRHNYVINKHRQNALSTFQVFVAAPTDPQIRDAVLLQAAKCIFSPQPTGYIHQETESSSTAQVFEVVRNLGEKK